MENNYKVYLKELNWEFIVIGEDEIKAIKKLRLYLEKVLIKEDGFTTMTCKAIDNISKSKFSIEEYVGFVVK